MKFETENCGRGIAFTGEHRRRGAVLSMGKDELSHLRPRSDWQVSGASFWRKKLATENLLL